MPFQIGRKIIRDSYPKEFNDELKLRIRARDKYTCQCCGILEEEHIILFGYSLFVHHIDYNKNNLSEANLVTTCHACNARANYNREYWIGLLFRNSSFMRWESSKV